MLKKQYRLKKRKSFNYIYRKGKHVGHALLTMTFVYARMKDSPLKIGFSASKKVGNSVVRHRAVRKMRAACKMVMASVKENHSIIFAAKPGIDKEHVNDIAKAMEVVLKKAGLWK